MDDCISSFTPKKNFDALLVSLHHGHMNTSVWGVPMSNDIVDKEARRCQGGLLERFFDQPEKMTASSQSKRATMGTRDSQFTSLHM